MNRSIEEVVQDQFGPRANAYVTSVVHASGEDLDALEAVAAQERPVRAIDLGAGGGHVAYRLARHAGAVMAVDLSADMLSAVARTARERGLANVETRIAPAEDLPFQEASFDFLGCRFSAHHWRDLEAGLRQARRVLKPGATAIFIDGVSPAVPAFDTHLQAVELLRDPSHVRDYTIGEWLEALARSGFVPRKVQAMRLRLEYASWVERMRTDPAHRVAIRSLQQSAAAETIRHFEIEPDGSFMLDTALFEVQRV